MTTIPIPEIYVLWHPRCQLGEKLARRIFAWLRPGNGLGPEVFFRSLPAPEAPASGLPPPLPGEPRGDGAPTGGSSKRVSNFQILFPLIDEHLVADSTWRYWLDDLARATEPRSIIPVALDATAYNMPASLRQLNYLRPAGLPNALSDSCDASALETAIQSLLKQVTEALCRILLPRGPGRSLQYGQATASEPPPKVNVFLSHAKQDGATPARRIRDYIYSQTQLAAFYDENDIPFGGVFGRVIEEDLESPHTAALIAIRSAKYSSRPWCRRELSLFRRPRRIRTATGPAEHWRLYPSLVVEFMEGGQISPGLAEMGNSSVIRWSDEARDIEELIVTTVIRDAMLAAFHSALGLSLPSALGLSLPSEPKKIILNWLPDPTTLLHIEAVQGAGERDVLYPGRGLSGLELDTLAELFPRLTFRSFEEVLL
jgi:hypothetical protein